MQKLKKKLGGQEGLIYKLTKMKMKMPSDGREKLDKEFKLLNEEIIDTFRNFDEI